MTAPNTKKPPTHVFFVYTPEDYGVYWRVGTVKSALKNSPDWSTRLRENNWHPQPRPGLTILRSEIGSTEGWVDFTEAFVKDGTWAW
ncbi:hypothetical protein [Microbispora sp. NPDC049633]|uniref:hypothetical protein n=1 Tax=Microbispora sp. NPDC049633 TaxID=3154355 RepID=UPI0034424BFA